MKGAEKLIARGRLPGAFAFDLAAQGLSHSARAGVPVLDLLPLAFASSWLVNSAIPSPVFRRWLVGPLANIWSELITTLAGGAWVWSTNSETDRETIQQAARALCVDGQGVGAISKVLALLVPDAVPLMPDAALWFALAALPRPEKPDAQTARIDAFLPMMNWFTKGATQAEADFESLARVSIAEGGPLLHPAQVFDRLIWFDSVGYRNFRDPSGAGWFWVVDGDRQAVVPVEVATTRTVPNGPIDLRDDSCSHEWRAAALRALDDG